jgi:hypothetical protein
MMISSINSVGSERNEGLSWAMHPLTDIKGRRRRRRRGVGSGNKK